MNEWKFLPLCDVFTFIFWKKLKTPKRHFEIIWPLTARNFNFICKTKWSFYFQGAKNRKKAKMASKLFFVVYICISTLWVSIRKSLGKTNPCALDQYMIKMYLRTSTKGQLISKFLFGIFNSLKIQRKKKSTLLLWYLKSNYFRSFFGRIEDTKMTFRN